MTHSYRFAVAVVAIVGACSPAAKTGDDDDSPDAGSTTPHMATFTPTWSVQNLDGSPATCMTGFDTMTISAVPWDGDLDSPDPGGMPVVATFDCAAGSGTMQLQTDGQLGEVTLNGKYNVSWEETDSTGVTIVATDLQTEIDYPTTVDLSSGAATASVTMYQNAGYAWIGWSLFGTMSNQFLDSCEGASVDMIGIDLTLDMSTTITHLMFPCDTSNGIVTGALGLASLTELDEVGSAIAPVLGGFYSLVATAYSGGQVVGVSDGNDDTTITAPNGIAIIPTFPTINLTSR